MVLLVLRCPSYWMNRLLFNTLYVPELLNWLSTKQFPYLMTFISLWSNQRPCYVRCYKRTSVKDKSRDKILDDRENILGSILYHYHRSYIIRHQFPQQSILIINRYCQHVSGFFFVLRFRQRSFNSNLFFYLNLLLTPHSPSRLPILSIAIFLCVFKYIFSVHTRLNITIASESLFKHIIFVSSLSLSLSFLHSIPQCPLLAHNRIVISEIERDKNVNVYSIYKYTYTNSTHDCITYLLNLFAKWNEIGAAKEINRDSFAAVFFFCYQVPKPICAFLLPPFSSPFYDTNFPRKSLWNYWH